jgi:hypothetical protein
MSTTQVTPEIDIESLKAEIANLSPEEIQKQLVELRTRQRVNQSKHQNSDKQKAYNKKRNLMFKLMTEKAKAAGVYDGILAQAKKNAAEILGTEAAAEEPNAELAED